METASWRSMSGEMDSGGESLRVPELRVMWEVPRLNASDYNYRLFWNEYMRANKPVLLTGLMDSWRACKDWVLEESGAPNLTFIAENFGGARVPVADCVRMEFAEQKTQEMTVLEFVKYWEELRQGSRTKASSRSDPSLYLKDWHFVKDFPSYCAYKTPEAFTDDWLNTYLDAFQMYSLNAEITTKRSIDDNQCSDYRFVYMGPKGTWTPLHADVFRSYSWSGNVCGRKRWLLLPPEQVHLVYDRFQRHTVYDIYSDVSEQQFPGFSQTRWMECNQAAGEILFVPSGWFHQVTNVEDTISINHNWINACNLHWAWKLLKADYQETVKSLEDIRSISDDLEFLYQRNLAANSGMNFLDFAVFVAKITDSNIKLLADLRRESRCGEDRSVMMVADSRKSPSEGEECVWKDTARQCLFNLRQITQILEEMIHEDVFQQQGDSFLTEVNCKHLEVVDNLRVKSENQVVAFPARCTSEHERSPLIRFISDFLFVSAQSAKSTEEGHKELEYNLHAEIDERIIRQAPVAGTSAGPSSLLKSIKYVVDLAARAGVAIPDFGKYPITFPVTLTVDPS